MQNYIYGFLYDVRHAYQGNREAFLVENDLDDNKRSWFNFKKRDVADKNVYYSFNYVLTDLVLDMILIKYFINKIDKNVNDVYNSNINMVNYFYSLVLNSLEELLTKTQFNKVKKSLLESTINDRIFIPQWF